MKEKFGNYEDSSDKIIIFFPTVNTKIARGPFLKINSNGALNSKAIIRRENRQKLLAQMMLAMGTNKYSTHTSLILIRNFYTKYENMYWALRVKRLGKKEALF